MEKKKLWKKKKIQQKNSNVRHELMSRDNFWLRLNCEVSHNIAEDRVPVGQWKRKKKKKKMKPTA